MRIERCFVYDQVLSFSDLDAVALGRGLAYSLAEGSKKLRTKLTRSLHLDSRRALVGRGDVNVQVCFGHLGGRDTILVGVCDRCIGLLDCSCAQRSYLRGVA
jgi:hypothetical protein